MKSYSTLAIFNPVEATEDNITTEQYQLEQARELVGTPQLPDEDINIEVIAHDAEYMFTDNLYNYNSGCLTENGTDFIRVTSNFTPDFMALFQYCSMYGNIPSPNEKTGKLDASIYKEYLGAYRYMQFASEYIAGTLSLPSQYKDEQEHFTRVSRYFLFKTKELCTLDKFSDLKSKLKDQFRVGKTPNYSAFDAVFESAMASSVIDAFSVQDTKSLLRQALSTIIQYTKYANDLPGFANVRAPFRNENGLIHYNTFVHDRASLFKYQWVFKPFELTKEDYESQIEMAEFRSTYVSSEVGKMFGKTPQGNTLVSIAFKTFSRKSSLDPDTVIVYVKYCGHREKYDLRYYSTQFVLPTFTNEPVRLKFQSHKTILGEVVIPNLDKPRQKLSEKIKEINLQNIGIIDVSIETKNYDGMTIIDQLEPAFRTNPSPADVLDFLVHVLIAEWVKSPESMTIEPPQHLYMYILNFCLSYSIPACTLYAKIVSRMKDCWNKSGAFIEAFTCVFIEYYKMIKEGGTAKDDELFKSTCALLREKVPRLLIFQLSKPELVTKACVMPLTMLLSLYYDKNDIEQYYSSLLNDTVDNISRSIYQKLEFKPSDEPCKTGVYEIYDIIPDDLKIDAPLDSFGKPKVEIEIDTVIGAANLLLQRARVLAGFFTKENLPSFANSSQDIWKIFSFATSLFTNLIIARSMEGISVIYQFLPIYKQLFSLLDMPEEMSPNVIFHDAAYQWLQLYGGEISNWAENALKEDDLSIDSKQLRTSTSVSDLFAFYNNSVALVKEMQLAFDNFEMFIVNYITITRSATVQYFDCIFGLLSNRYRKYSVDEKKWFNSIKKETRIPTTTQVYILLNNVMRTWSFWKNFLENVQKMMDVGMKVDLDYSTTEDRIQWIMQASALDHAHDFYDYFYPQFWVKSTKGMRKIEFNPHSLYLSSDMQNEFKQIFQQKLSDINTVLAYKKYEKDAIKNVFRGVQLALAELLMPFLTFQDDDVYLQVIGVFGSFVMSALNVIRQCASEDIYQCCVEEENLNSEFQFTIIHPYEELAQMRQKETDKMKRTMYLITMAQLKPKFSILPSPDNYSFFDPIE